jgi:hypothetical protein
MDFAAAVGVAARVLNSHLGGIQTMGRSVRWGILLALLTAVAWTAAARAQGDPKPEGVFENAKDQYAWDQAHPRFGADSAASVDSVKAANTDGTFWANGPFNGNNGWSAEINGLGFITNRHADDFVSGAPAGVLPLNFSTCLQPIITKARASLLDQSSPARAEAGVWRSNVASGNGPENDATPTIVPYVFTSVVSQLGTAFGYPVNEYTWTISPPVTLPTGRFWLSTAADLSTNTNGRGFWATSSGGRNGLGTQTAFQRGFFGGTNWVSNASAGQLAFDIDGACNLTLAGTLVGVKAGAATANDSGVKLNNLGTTTMSVDATPDQAGGRTAYCETGRGNVQFTLTTGATGFTDLPTNEFVATIGAGVTVISCTASVGTCSVSGSTVTWNLGLGANSSANILIAVQSQGGIQTKLSVPIGLVLTIQNTGSTVTTVFNINTRADFACVGSVDPNAQLGRQVHLPILNFQGQDEVCDTWIEVQVIGCDPAKAVLVTWADPGFCPPQAAGPLKVECTGLLRPGSTWNMLMAQIPTGSKSGMLFKFTARQLLEVGIDLGFDDVVADTMCETLFFGIVGDADDYRRFKKAYNEGLEFAGIRQDIAAGEGFLAVDVVRKCPGDVTPTAKVTSSYDGIAGTHLGTYDPAFGGYGYYVPLLYADKGNMNSIMYIQNGGLECSSIEIWFKAQDDCLRAKICEVFTLAPGESYQFDSTDCVGPDWQGSAWLRSSQPLGIAVDLIGRDVMMTYVGEPSEINYTYDPNKAFSTSGNQVAFGPLIYSEYQGWDTGIQVQNLSSVVNAKVKVYFLDRSGDIITTLVDWICPRGSQTFFLPVVHDLPGTWVGSVRVESQEWWSPGSPIVSPPNIVAVAQLIKYNDAARTQTQEAIAYNLLPEHKIFDWQIGYAGGGTASGVGLIAVPSLLKDLDGPTGTTSELAIANIVPKPGFTDFAIFIYDQNGLLDYVCQKMSEKEVEYIDLQTWGYVNPGFKGSAIISATFWEHDVFDGNGAFLRNLVGLGAVSIQRTGTRLGEDIPGDEAAGDRAIPFGLSQIADLRCQLGRGAIGPLCPGQGGAGRVITNCQIPALRVQAVDTPLNIQQGQTIASRLPVSAPAGCLIGDLNVWVSFDSAVMSDLSNVTLVSPNGTSVRLFGGICGSSTGQIRAVLDDEATLSIGTASICIPDQFLSYIPSSPLSAFDGQDPNGTWVLNSTDASTFTGVHTLFYWELQMQFQ